MTDIDPIMQAAERLRQFNAKLDEQYVDTMRPSDEAALAAFALSILPKVKRPVTMALQGQAVEAGERWFVDTDGEIVHRGCACDDCLRNTLSFATKAEAELEYHWQEFEKFLAEFAAR